MRNINISYMHFYKFKQCIHNFKDQILKLYFLYLYIIQQQYKIKLELFMMVLVMLELVKQ